jgi:plastocyanin
LARQIHVFTTILAAFSTLALAAGVPDTAVTGVVRTGSKPQVNAVVWLEPDARAPRRERPHPVMDQRNLQFAPQVLAVQVGAKVDFPNNDRVFHNVFSFHDGKKFDLGVYPIGATKPVVFEKPGVSRLFCNIHPNMAAYVVAVDSPYYAVSGPDGTFTIEEVPPGTYAYHAWRPGAPALHGTFTIEPGRALEIRWP